MLLGLFLGTFANGTTSILYNSFINSQTSASDLNINYIAAGVESDFPGYPVILQLWLDDPSNINETMIDSLRRMIVDEISVVHGFKDGSEELLSFNKDVQS